MASLHTLNDTNVHFVKVGAPKELSLDALGTGSNSVRVLPSAVSDGGDGQLFPLGVLSSYTCQYSGGGATLFHSGPGHVVPIDAVGGL